MQGWQKMSFLETFWRWKRPFIWESILSVWKVLQFKYFCKEKNFDSKASKLQKKNFLRDNPLCWNTAIESCSKFNNSKGRFHVADILRTGPFCRRAIMNDIFMRHPITVTYQKQSNYLRNSTFFTTIRHFRFWIETRSKTNLSACVWFCSKLPTCRWVRVKNENSSAPWRHSKHSLRS